MKTASAGSQEQSEPPRQDARAARVVSGGSGPMDDALLELDTARAELQAAKDAVAHIEELIAAAAQDADAAAEAFAAAERSIEKGETTDITQIEQAGRELQAARERHERLTRTALPAVRRRLDEAARVELHIVGLLKYEAVKRQSEAASEMLTQEYPVIGARLVELVKVVAEATMAVAQVNAELPKGRSPLADPEGHVRDLSALSEDVLTTRKEKRWIYVRTQAILSDQDAEKVRQIDGDRGVLTLQAHTGPDHVEVVRRDCIVETYYGARRAMTGPRLAALDVPGLTAFSSFIKPSPSAAPSADLAQLGTGQGALLREDRPVLTRVKVADPGPNSRVQSTSWHELPTVGSTVQRL